MSSKTAHEDWARTALACALYECLIAASCRMKNDAELLAGEAAWRTPTAEEWATWSTRRRVVDDSRREPDPLK